MTGRRSTALGVTLLMAALVGIPVVAAARPASEPGRPAAGDPTPVHPPIASSRTRTPPRADTALRIGLALSGGSARGFAHIGVLRALEAMDVPVHAVAGVSMGAVVGALHSAGYGADDLEELAVGRDWNAFFAETEPAGTAWPWATPEADRHVISLPLRSGRPTLPTGLVAGQRVTQLLTRLTWHVHPTDDFRRLPVPFATLATDLETGEPVPLEHGFLPLALRASLSIPSIFTPVRMQGRYLVDGGVSRNLPAEDVRRLGADVVVCSDVTEPLEPADSLRSFLDVLTQTISFRTVRDAERQRELCDILIRPELEGAGTYAFDRAATWIGRGDSAARVHEDTLKILSRRAGPAPVRPVPPATRAGPDSVVITGVHFPALTAGRERYLRRLMDLRPGEATTVERVDREVERLYGAGLFARVGYRLTETTSGPGGGPDGDPPHRALVVETAPEGRRELRAGLRFDSQRQAAVLFTADLPRLPSFGSAARLDARLGEQLHLQARQRLRPGFAPGFLLGAGIRYHRTPLELRPPTVEERQQVASEALEGRLVVGRLLGSGGMITVEGGAEWFEADPDEGSAPPEAGGWLASVAGAVTYDSRDPVAFPHSGGRVDLRLEAVTDVGAAGRELAQSWGDVELHVPLGPRWTARGRATLGATAGDAPPLHRSFFLGGAVPDRVAPRRRLTLPGLAPQELRGETLLRAEAGVQVRLDRDVYLTGGWTAGDARQRWDVRPEDWVHGFDLGVGVRTPFGPLRLTVADATTGGGPRVAVDAGGQF